ncbi:hypothetical protein BH09BAC3_BH09BAC3_30410 [soil metagenome]
MSSEKIKSASIENSRIHETEDSANSITVKSISIEKQRAPETGESAEKLPVTEPAAVRTPIKGAKAKTSLNLQGIFKPTNATSANEKVEEIKEKIINEVIKLEKLMEVWHEYAEQRKNQAGEYQLLKREFEFEHPVVFVILTNPVEETLIENFRRDFITFLRDRLKNSELTIKTKLRQTEGKRVIYTAKEKFEHLAEKNPYLNELKERLGLDWDF